MDQIVKQVQEFLDKAARDCLRFSAARTLKPKQYHQLMKFVYACMYQKCNLPSRVKKRGMAELNKILEFAAKAAAVFKEIDDDNNV